MIFRLLVVSALISPFFFPWIYTVVITAVVMFKYPFVALAVGLELDALYFSPSITALPLATSYGVLAVLAVLLVRRFVRTQMLFN